MKTSDNLQCQGTEGNVIKYILLSVYNYPRK